jgi:hypothetical protein
MMFQENNVAKYERERSMSTYRERRSQLHRVFLTPASEKTPGTPGTWQLTRWSICNGEMFAATFSDLPNLGPKHIVFLLMLVQRQTPSFITRWGRVI